MYRQNLFLKTHSLIEAIQILALLTLLSTPLQAQNLAWAKSAGGSAFDEGLGIAVDGAGNSYVTGSFNTSATFGLGQANQTTLSGIGDEIFVAKYDPTGALLWAKNAGGSSGLDEGIGITVDGAGNSYVTGIFNVSATFGLGEASQTTLSGADNEIFVAKYNSSGGLVWAKSAGGPSGDGGYSIDADDVGNSYATGVFNNSATFGAGEANEITLFGASVIFVAKYNPSGALVWAKGVSSANSQGNEIKVDGAGNSYVTGFFDTSTIFGLGEANQTTLSGAGFEIFLAKYNPSGGLIWAKRAGGPNRDEALSTAVDGSGNSYVAGKFDESATFGPGEANQITLLGTNSEIFVAKYDLTGALVWAKSAGGTVIDVGYGIDVDGLGNSYITGRFENSAIFGLGETNQTILSGIGSEIFVAKYNSIGALVWAKSVSGPSNETSYSIALDGLGNSYVTGLFFFSAIFGAGEANQTTLSGTNGEMFVARYGSTLIESFGDGNFASNPIWGGTTSTWQVVTSSDVGAGATNSSTLRLNVASGSGTKYLSTLRPASWGTEQSWSFWLGRRAEAATNTNHSIVWLWANETNLTSSTVDGYRIRFGDNTDGDNIVLQRVTNGIANDILASSGTVPNGRTDIGFMVRVTRTSSSLWTLYTSTLPTLNGSGAVATAIPTTANTPVIQGSVTNSTYTNFANGYFGFMAVHTSASNARTGAEFDQLYFDTSSASPLGKPVFENVMAEGSASNPQAFQLFQNFPNPFNPSTTISFDLPRASAVTLKIFDLVGHEVATLAKQKMQAGRYSFKWDASGMPGGVYFYRLQTETFTQRRKLLLLR